ncbi:MULTISPECIES: ArsR/SmtB family transcription factor [Sulfitobacter]|jgi:DNA-binding transcriptional ArsR family regulator|uniref:ArsR/SmtB family transcription factor n=1 Tax=Sulfitobacter profundi TaxID=2679961 RepID=A0ABW1Z597_9RHOB|nr:MULTISPECIES: helix-turn-helix transcriptional regulator [Sulfitobacter]AYE88029.1 transcriptional regulator [Sulfitobacter sp. D7]MCZ4368296.1 helix-turn-helix transcriptional regulator [Sulfitobacter dubius]|tara:strand:- start:183 stop:545 length:363 start_codon:yes stop_codon:yes gene_type:complete
MSIEDKFDAVFKALGHRARRRILDLIKDGPETTGALCGRLTDLDRCTVMQHLSVLEKAGLVVVERRGRERWNHLDALPIHDVQNRWIGPYAAHAVAVLESLEAFAETEAASPDDAGTSSD